jgi:molybdate transport system substrate-binding protein
MRWTLSAVLPVLVVSVAACTSGSATAAPARPVTVFAAASLTESFNELQQALASSSSGLDITYSFAGSGALVAQVQQGAPADVIATADDATMQRLRDTGLVEQPTRFARNQLEILVAPGNPQHVKGLADLARSDLKVVLGDTTVPAGEYATQILRSAGVTVHPVSLEVDVRSAVAKVTSGEADATIVYVTDVREAGRRGQGVAIPKAQNVVADYPIAIVASTKHHEAAAAFVDDVVRGQGERALRAHGFLAGG